MHKNYLSPFAFKQLEVAFARRFGHLRSCYAYTNSYIRLQALGAAQTDLLIVLCTDIHSMYWGELGQVHLLIINYYRSREPSARCHASKKVAEMGFMEIMAFDIASAKARYAYLYARLLYRRHIPRSSNLTVPTPHQLRYDFF